MVPKVGCGWEAVFFFYLFTYSFCAESCRTSRVWQLFYGTFLVDTRRFVNGIISLTETKTKRPVNDVQNIRSIIDLKISRVYTDCYFYTAYQFICCW